MKIVNTEINDELFCMVEREGRLSCKKSRVSTFSGSSAALLALTIMPAVLKSLSDGTDVATIPRYFCAILAKCGYD